MKAPPKAMHASALTDDALAALLDAHAPWRPLAAVRGMSAWQAADEVPFWEALEARCGPLAGAPFFCVAWPGAQALGAALLERVIDVQGRRVVDVGCGSGVAGVAAGRAGAREVAVADVDAMAVQAARILGRRHGVACASAVLDVLAHPDLLGDGDVAVCADLIYNSDQAARFAAVISDWRRRGVDVLVADSGRPFFDAGRFGLAPVFTLEVDVAASVDGRARRTARVFVLEQP